MQGIDIRVVNKDAFDVQADVLVLKYAQASRGLTRQVIERTEQAGFSIDLEQLTPWNHLLTTSYEMTSTKKLLVIGTPPLGKFNYKEIREFGRKSMSILAEDAPRTQSVLLTIHGPGYGLDEAEAFESLVAGLMDSVQSDDFPAALKKIIFVERGPGRVKRMQAILDKLFPEGKIPTAREGGYRSIARMSAETLRSAGYESESKKRVFVAMPFADEFDDIYHYGIQGAINRAGYLCERADMSAFTGDVMKWVKDRIATADLVVADLTGANPNVYLEVGYAWGKGRPTVLLISDAEELKFDVQGQRCLVYSKIRDLEEKLKEELLKLEA